MWLNTSYDKATRTWSGKPVQPIYNPNVNIAVVLFNSLARTPCHIGQINADSGRQLTNEQIRLNAIRVALRLQRGHHRDVQPNDVIAVISRNHELLSAVVLAAFALGAPISTLDPSFKADEIAHIFQSTRPKFVFCDSSSILELRKALGDLAWDTNPKLVTVDRKVDDLDCVDEWLEPYDDEHLFVPVDIVDGSKHPAVIVCTSGTTGKSKGVTVSHALLLFQISNTIPLVTGDVFLSFSSLYWLTGYMSFVGGILAGITRINTTESFTPELMLRYIERYGATITMTPPAQVASMLQSPIVESTNLSTMRNFFCGGSAVPQELQNKFNRLLPSGMQVVYGLSEACGFVTTNRAFVEGSAGQLHDGIQVQVVDKDGCRCGPGEDGELFVKLPYSSLGYWRNEAATAEMLDAEGWLHSGDVGHFDEDRNLFMIDRIKDMLKYRGNQMSPSDLENLIVTMDGVAQVCVVGVPDVISTDLPAAVIVRAAGHDVKSEAVKALIKDKLSDFKQLRGGVYFVDSLPVTPSGKVVRRKVKEIAIELFHNQRF